MGICKRIAAAAAAVVLFFSGVTTLVFPASDAGKTEANSEVYAVEPFSVALTLPDGWSTKERDVTADNTGKPLNLASVFSVYDIYNENNTLVGAIGYNIYEPYEGDADSIGVVYSQVRMGSVYRFDTDDSYTVVSETERGKVATADVILQAEEGKPTAAAAETRSLGILAYDNQKHVFVAVELDPSAVTAEQQTAIAKSLKIK